MDVGLKAFYPHVKAARYSIAYLQAQGVKVKQVKFYKKGAGRPEFFNASANVAQKVRRWGGIGFMMGFGISLLLSGILMFFGIINPFHEMSSFLSLAIISLVGGVFCLAVMATVGVIISEDKVDIAQSDFNGANVVVDMHVDLKDGVVVDELLKMSGAQNVTRE